MRLIRLFVLLLIAFVAGMLFERNAQADRCIALGGQWLPGSICSALDPANGAIEG
ncbi:hypothetical protein ACN2XU_16445 [Primorskyibacter sp. 2E107]|uniref:hypothetical protein n=1 Tax=Primorskyibacter sp. 2E107 TaxID=3403458 RepID=UPI003AF6AA9B